jgi:KDO2-lipid IV(A) lauroyltransferase
LTVLPPRKPWREKKRRANDRRRSRERLGRLLRGLHRVAALLPERLVAGAGEAGGLLAWALFSRIRARARRQLRDRLSSTVPPRERPAVVRRVFRGFGRSVGEVLSAAGRGMASFESRLDIEGEEHLRAALARGRGVVLVSAHFGNFELLGGFLARRCDLRAVARAPRGDAADGAIAAIREALGVRTISQSSPRGVLRALKEGAVVAVLPDQDIHRIDGEFLPFLGREAYTATGPASLALKAGAPVLPAFLRRDGRRFRVVFQPAAIPDGAAPDREAEVRRLTLAWTAAVESEVRARPDHWVWFHRRWHTTPARLEERRARRARKESARTAARDPA